MAVEENEDESEWVGDSSYGRTECIISCDVGSGCASGASCAPPCDVLCLVDDWPYVLLWGNRARQRPRGTKRGKITIRNEGADSIHKSGSGSRSRSTQLGIEGARRNARSGNRAFSWAVRSSRLRKAWPAPAEALAFLFVRILGPQRLDRAVQQGPGQAGRASSAAPRRVQFPCL